MCGIIAYSGTDNAAPYLIDGISKLEYRGYDSCGCAFVIDGEIVVRKDSGSVSHFLNKHEVSSIVSSTGIFHTRWATTGRVCAENAHPFTDCSQSLAVVHNGVVENSAFLKSILGEHNFTSETDSEVICHLIEEKLYGGLLSEEEAVVSVAQMLKGDSSFVVMFRNSQKLIAVKQGSSLILAIGKRGIFVSSDVYSILNYTNKIVYLHDGDAVVVDSSGYLVHNYLYSDIKHEVVEVDLETIISNKGDFPYFMEKEIYDELEVWKKVELDSETLAEAAKAIKQSDRIFLIGEGSSYYAAQYGARLFREAGISAFSFQGHEFDNYESIVHHNDVMLFISQSGETADLIYAMKKVKSSLKIGIINAQGSEIARNMDIVIPMNAGQEVSVAATKSFMMSLMALYSIAAIIKNDMGGLKNDLKLLEMVIYNQLTPSFFVALNDIIKRLEDIPNLILAGLGYSYIIALEGGLKMKEVAYVNVETMDLQSMKHGPLALVSQGSCIISVLTGQDVQAGVNLEELKTRGATVVGISSKLLPSYDLFIRTADAGRFTFLAPLIILQMLAYKLSLSKGINPDMPRNLAKSVTVK